MAQPVGAFSLAGFQPKVSVIEVEVCEECWLQMKASRPKESINGE